MATALRLDENAGMDSARSNRVVIASAPHADTFGYSMPPPGLLRLGGELRRRGFEPVLDDLAFALARAELALDASLPRRAAERLLAHEPGLALGLSTMGATLPIALAIAAEVAALRPGLPILLGGPGTTGTDAALLERFPAIAAVVRGEGEFTLPELLERLRARDSEAIEFSGIAGVTWRDAHGRVQREAERAPLDDLGELAPYAWDLLPSIAEYKALTAEPDGLVPIDSGRGCVYACSFCTIPAFWGRRSRTLPAARLADEIASLEDIDGARSAYLCHDLFGADRAHALELCAELERRGARTPFEIRARIDHLDDELIAALARAGCYRVLLGIESADGELRNANGKGMRADLDVLGRLDALSAAGIVPILSLILGLPGADERELRATLDLSLRASLRHGVQISLHLVNPQPGCELGDQFGSSSHALDGIPPDMALGAGRTAPERELIEAHPDLFSTWSLLTSLPGGEAHLRELHRIATEFGPLLMRYPQTLALFAHIAGFDALDLWQHWRNSARSFEGLVMQRDDRLLRQVMDWEQAKLRAAAELIAARDREVPTSCAEIVTLGIEPAALREFIDVPFERRPRRVPARSGDGVRVAVVRSERSVRTLRVTPDVARLASAYRAGRLDPARDSHRAAIQALVDLGLVPKLNVDDRPHSDAPVTTAAPRPNRQPTKQP